MTTDPVTLTADLIRCPSVTPDEGGALILLEGLLTGAGFTCTRVDRNGTPNLFARWGAKGAVRTFGFNGHTDVVPIGNPADWTRDPFGGQIEGGILWGRGATDMKSGVAAFAAAAVDFVTATPPDGAVILAITGDEEGPGRDGTIALLDWMGQQGERMDVCLVGEPTSTEVLGDMMKIGRRGSLTFNITATGVQGHAAYPHRAKNPLHALTALLAQMTAAPLDQGTDHFDPSTLQITTIDCGNPANNVIPARATATVNVRFNDAHSAGSLRDWAEGLAAQVTATTGVGLDIRTDVSGDSFVTPPGALVDLVAGVVRDLTGQAPVLSTSGGTSDARFVKDHCPVVEFGLVGKTMHQVDEQVPVDQITALTAVYHQILRRYFNGGAA
ncbi:succinyl-diaminopimelate desuccinylase [Paracoccus sp. p3-h83]|uniref:succinyl-diaminopimelate desuccinylase n=1 Tax=Paracoccus sp. p3-h83 TaxID=3342805 RepID=UPI0035B7DE5D